MLCRPLSPEREGSPGWRETRVSPAKLCDPVNPAPSGQPGQSGNVCWWGVEPPSDILARDLEVRARAGAGSCPALLPRDGQLSKRRCIRGSQVSAGTPRSSTVTPRGWDRIQRRLCAVNPFNKSVNNHYCGGWMKSYI